MLKPNTVGGQGESTHCGERNRNWILHIAALRARIKISDVGGTQETGIIWSPGKEDASKEDKGPVPCPPKLQTDLHSTRGKGPRHQEETKEK